jgi:glycerate dehydrogenase
MKPFPAICILDGDTTNPGDLSWSPLELLGTLAVHDLTPPELLEERAKNAEILITNKTLITAKILLNLPKLRMIGLLSTGTNAVDLTACAARGIPVCNVPAYSTASVAEMVFALLLGWARAAETHHASVNTGAWQGNPGFCYYLTPQVELSGKTLGVLGFGDIGQAVTRIALALGMKVLAFTPHPEGKPALGQRFVSLEDLLAEADVVSLHCPLTPTTTRLMNRERLSLMKAGSVLVNTGRGGLIDEPALAEALRQGRPGVALLDVLTREPPEAGNPLIGLPNCRITPHIAWATREARARLIGEVAANVRGFLTGQPRNVVNGV